MWANELNAKGEKLTDKDFDEEALKNMRCELAKKENDDPFYECGDKDFKNGKLP